MKKSLCIIYLLATVALLGTGVLLGYLMFTPEQSEIPKHLKIKELVIAHVNKEHERPFDHAGFVFETVDFRADGMVVVLGFRRTHFAQPSNSSGWQRDVIDRFWVEVSTDGEEADWKVNTIHFQMMRAQSPFEESMQNERP